MRLQRPPWSPRLALLRVLAVLVLAVVSLLGLNGFVTSSSDCCSPMAAEVEQRRADECCDGPEAGATDGRAGDHCPCPLPCNPGCAGQSLRALASGPTGVVSEPAGARLDQSIPRQTRPPGPEPGDILHVPKSIRC